MKDQAKELLKEVKNNNYELYDDVFNFLVDYQNETGADFGIITAEDLDYMTEQQAKEGGFARVACLLNKVESLNADYYHLDGYGNAEDFHISDAELYLEDIINGYYD